MASPKVSRAPRTIGIAHRRSRTRPPRNNTMECSCKLCLRHRCMPSPRCRWKDGPDKPEAAEFGFLGVTVRTGGRRLDAEDSLQVTGLRSGVLLSRGRRMSWLVVGIENPEQPRHGASRQFSGSRAMGQGLHRPPQLLPIASSTLDGLIPVHFGGAVSSSRVTVRGRGQFGQRKDSGLHLCPGPSPPVQIGSEEVGSMDLAGQRKDSGVSLCRHLLAKVEIGPPLVHPRGPHNNETNSW